MLYAIQLCKRQDAGFPKVVRTYNEELEPSQMPAKAKALLRGATGAERPDYVKAIALGAENSPGSFVFEWAIEDQD
jgi:hypothetical protein